ncbi:hypothetical protein Tco_0298879 [Tanacetum coccineum]
MSSIVELSKPYDCKVTLRSRPSTIPFIKERLSKTNKRLKLFKDTVFGKYLDLEVEDNDNHLLNYVLHHQRPELSKSVDSNLVFDIASHTLLFRRIRSDTKGVAWTMREGFEKQNYPQLFGPIRSGLVSVRPADVPMSVGGSAGSAANVLDEELEMVVAGPVANNAVGAERVIAPSSDVDSKAKRVTFPNSVGCPSFKERKHVVLDEGPSSPKSVPDFTPPDEACKTLFGSLASMEDPVDSDPFLLGIEEACSSCNVLCNLS